MPGTNQGSWLVAVALIAVPHPSDAGRPIIFVADPL
jgi:hypothetical protein